MILSSFVNAQRGARRNYATAALASPLLPLEFLLQEYSCVRPDEHVSYGNQGDTVPPFGLAFSSASTLQHVLAVANEEGIVRLYNTESRQNVLLKEWLAHENAVFDLAWVPGEPQLVTAAGDQMARLWDVRSGDLLGSFRGHLCSLKSVAFTPQDKAVFCTGARDGNIMVWDTRCSKKDGFYKQVKQISGAHNKPEASALSKNKKRRSGTRGMGPSVDSQQSVTVVLLRDQHTLLSSGAVDGVVKMWDLRKHYSVHRQDPVPAQTFPYPGSSARTRLGYSGLVLDSSRSHVFCNCTDDNIYMFNISGAKTAPVCVFGGHQNSSFYIRSSVSPDDQFLASGSSDSHAYIWKISSPSRPPMMLQGHSEEVTSVSWCPTDFTKIASCSDDHSVRIWRLRRQTEEAASRLGETNLVGWTRPKTPTKDRAAAESTLAQSPPPHRATSRALSSPTPAACASNSASLPLPSSTSSPTSRPKTPTSLTRWLSPTPPTVLSPQTRQDKHGAKRRLEASAPLCCSEPCVCVRELAPNKRRREEEEEEERGERRREEEIICCQQEKENLLPQRNWLSAMSQKIRSSQSPRRGTPASPTTSSPSSMKKISSYFNKPTAE